MKTEDMIKEIESFGGEVSYEDDGDVVIEFGFFAVYGDTLQEAYNNFKSAISNK